MLSAIESWRKLFKIESVCFVGDRAMFTKGNMALLEKHQCQYIIPAKLKSLSESKKEEVLEQKNYRPTVLNNSFGWIGEFEHAGSRLIVTYKNKRAMKDAKDRQAVIEKVKKVIGTKGNPSRLITNAGVKKYVTKDKDASISLDEEKIALFIKGFSQLITQLANTLSTDGCIKYNNRIYFFSKN